MSATTKRDVVDAAMSIAKDAAEGRLSPAELDAAVVEECRELFGIVVGEGDPMWPVQVEVARAVLAAGGISIDEQVEWLAVARHRAQMAIGSAEGAPIPAAPVSLASGAARADNDGLDADD
jgi:hypothetical protein